MLPGNFKITRLRPHGTGSLRSWSIFFSHAARLGRSLPGETIVREGREEAGEGGGDGWVGGKLMFI